MNDRKSQLALDLRIRAATGRENFLVSASNDEAVRWIDRWPDWPATATVLTGPPGCGKTHLGMVWRARAGAVEWRGIESVDLADPPRGVAVLVDDVDRLNDDAGLFHLFNAVAGVAGSLLFTARTPPARWGGRLPDLVSRLSAAPTVAVQPPDEQLIAAVMLKMFADQHLAVEPEVLQYLVVRMERSFEAARAIVDELNRVSLAERRAVTIPLARQVLDRRAEGTGQAR